MSAPDRCAGTIVVMAFLAAICTPVSGQEYSALPHAERAERIYWITDVVNVHRDVVDAIWGPAGWPVTATATLSSNSVDLTTLELVDLIPSAAVSRAEELEVNVTFDGYTHTTRAYHLIPIAPPNNRLVIVHHGHSHSFFGEFGLPELLSRLLTAGYSVLAMYEPNYHPVVTPTPAFSSYCVPSGDCTANRNNDGTVHDAIFAAHGWSPSTFRVFLEPVAACINYLRANYDYLDFSMAGLSGGGWTTVLYSAIDGSIRTSASASGSLPVDLRLPLDGDGEQVLDAFYGGAVLGVAGYRDLYTLAAFGYSRKHVQVQNYDESGSGCCFDPVEHPGLLDPVTGLGAMPTYRSEIQQRLVSAGAAPSAFDYFFPTLPPTPADNGLRHMISPGGRDRIVSDVGNSPPTSSPLFRYHASTGVGTFGLLRNGKYTDVGAISGFNTTWTHVVATKNQKLLFYRSSDGFAATGRLGDDCSYSYVGLAPDVGPGWTHITPVNSQFLFFYDKASGTAQVGTIDGSAGVYSNVGPRLTGFNEAWTDVVGLFNGGLFFLDRIGRNGATGWVDATGRYDFTSTLSGFSTWTGVAAVNNNVLFFFDSATGTTATAVLDPHGVYAYCGAFTGALGATDVAGGRNGTLVVLNSSTSSGQIWFVDEFGIPRVVQSVTGLGPWTKITAD